MAKTEISWFEPSFKRALQMENDFQPRIGFKTRYGMVANPFAGGAAGSETGTNRANQYYRIFAVTNILAS